MEQMIKRYYQKRTDKSSFHSYPHRNELKIADGFLLIY